LGSGLFQDRGIGAKISFALFKLKLCKRDFQLEINNIFIFQAQIYAKGLFSVR
jgi:hypothetical protein